MFAYLTSLYQPVMHDIFQALMAVAPDEMLWPFTATLGAGLLSAMCIELWRDKSEPSRIPAPVVVALVVGFAGACARQLYVFGFEGRRLVSAVVLVWLVPVVALTLAYELARWVGRVRARGVATARVDRGSF